MRIKIFISILTVIILLTGCKKISSIADPQQTDPGGPPLVTPIGTPVGTPVSKTIGSAGGSLISPDGKLELNIPVGALTGNTAISIQPVTNFCPGGIDLAYHLMPDNITFSKPVTLTYHYTDDDVNGSHPYLLFIAYQDSSQAWKADLKKRNVDTIAKTVSLGISHFSIWSMGANLQLLLDPLDEELYEKETREISVVEVTPGSLAFAGSHSDDLFSLPQSTRLPDNVVRRWTLVGSASAIGANGTLSAIGGTSKVTYTAPAPIDDRRTVQVSVEIDYVVAFYNNGRLVASVSRLILFKDITLLPSIFEYSVKIHYKDPEVFGYHGKDKQVYEDSASFDLSITKIKGNMGQPTVFALISNLKNDPPKVEPKTQAYNDGFSIFTWEWMPDNIGVMNITAITLTDYDATTSFVSLLLEHSGTLKPGFKWSTSVGGGSGTQAPTPYGAAKQGLPTHLDLKLIPEDQTFKSVHGTANVQISCVFKP